MNRVNKIVGTNLKELRINKKLNLEDLAIILSISKSAYYRIENGLTNSWTNIIFIAVDYYKINLSDFFITNDNSKLNTELLAHKKEILIKQKLEYLKSELEATIAILNQKNN